MYGLSGASGKSNTTGNIIVRILTLGRHCCLWCLATSEEMLNPPQSISLRTTDSIEDDYKRFVGAGADLKKAEFFNNVVRQTFFKIPLEQVRNHNF